jgi:hypothetical protein
MRHRRTDLANTEKIGAVSNADPRHPEANDDVPKQNQRPLFLPRSVGIPFF